MSLVTFSKARKASSELKKIAKGVAVGFEPWLKALLKERELSESD